MEQESTSGLLKVLKTTSRERIEAYRDAHIVGKVPTYREYMDELVEAKGLKRQQIFQKADIPQKYGYRLLTGENRTRKRDLLLRIFIAMNLTLKEAQRCLELYGMPTLYPKVKRDALVIIALNKGVSSVDTVNDWLREEGEPELETYGET